MTLQCICLLYVWTQWLTLVLLHFDTAVYGTYGGHSRTMVPPGN